MKVFVTGATGFIGGELARRLRERGDDVLALVRTPAKAGALRELGCSLVEGDLADRAAIEKAMAGCDAVVHAAAVYEVGIPASRRPAMHSANVGGTETVLSAALAAGVAKVVYVSSVVTFGNTHGEVVDETFVHPRESYTSYYEQTKVMAHDVATTLGEQGLPLVIVMPGTVYGPGDHSEIGAMIDRFVAGKLPALMFPDFGPSLVHRDDVAEGLLLALEKGRLGESYVLTERATTMRGLIDAVAEVTGRKPLRRAVPSVVLRASAPLGPLLGPLMGFPPNLRELVSSSDGVTFWATADKARRELGFAPRPLREGLSYLAH